MQLEQMYQEIILDHYKNPQGKGLREPFDVEVHHINPTCGDEVTMRVRLVPGPDGAGEAVEFSYDGDGCSISQASTSVLFDQPRRRGGGRGHGRRRRVPGAAAVRQPWLHPDEDVLGDAVAFSGVAKYPARVKCALLGWMAWKDAVAQALAAQEAQPGREGGEKEQT